MPDKLSATVAFQGELGAFSHSAMRKLLGSRAKPLPCPLFRDVFEALRLGKTNYAVLPIENTLHGSVHENYDHLLDYNFTVVGETSLRISHQLITLPDVSFRDVRQVYSHPVALNQCRDFFLRNRQLEPVPFYDTAGSVKMLTQNRPTAAAAIASETAAQIYRAVVRKRNIEDDPQNFTRFFLLTKPSRKLNSPNVNAKTSLVFSMPNLPGALFKALACFALREINLTKIESRPLRGKPWEYFFYVDLVGALHDDTVQNAIANLRELAAFVRILGSYRPTP